MPTVSEQVITGKRLIVWMLCSIAIGLTLIIFVPPFNANPCADAPNDVTLVCHNWGPMFAMSASLAIGYILAVVMPDRGKSFLPARS